MPNQLIKGVLETQVQRGASGSGSTTQTHTHTHPLKTRSPTLPYT